MFGKFSYLSLVNTFFLSTRSLTSRCKPTILKFKVKVQFFNPAFIGKCCNTQLEARVSNIRVVVSACILKFALRGIFVLKQAQLKILQLTASLNVPQIWEKRRYMGEKKRGFQIMNIFRKQL